MNKVLILAYYFPPIVASGSHRPAGFSAHLPSLDYEPVILTTEHHKVHPPVDVDMSLMQLIDEKLEIHRLSHFNLQKTLLKARKDIRAKAQGNVSKPIIPGGDEPQSVLGGLKAAVLDRIFRFPDQQRPWGNAAVKFACGLSKEDRPDVIFATGNPWSALVAGCEISRKIGVPFVADFRDPWTDNPKPPLSHSLGIKAGKNWKKEYSRRLLASSPTPKT